MYELVYYNKNDDKKNVIVSDTLKKIDVFITKYNVTNELGLLQYTNCNINKYDRVSIVSKDNKHSRKVLYLNDLSVMNDKNFIDNVYNLYIRDKKFKDEFENAIVYPLLDIKKECKIKDVARYLLLMYPNYGAFYQFYNSYLESKIKSDKDNIWMEINYSKLRKIAEVYINYVKNMNKTNNNSNIKNNKIL